MKNLLIYITPTESFDNYRLDMANDAHVLIQVQLDSVIAAGWKEIMFFTNFHYQYRGIKAEILEGVEFCERKPQVTKINAIVRLFETGRIKDGELYFFHDIDAFQMTSISEEEVRREMGTANIGVTLYGHRNLWNTGVMFFDSGAEDMFRYMKDSTKKNSINEEQALWFMSSHKKAYIPRIKRLNSTYNFLPWNLRECYKEAIKPLKVAHFHPFVDMPKLGIPKPLDFYKGKNKLGIPLITKELIQIFDAHEII
jgi:hypothetical protein